MKANEMEAGTWDEGGQALEEFQRGHHQMGGAIAVRGFELEDDVTGWRAAEAFVAQGGARDVATEDLNGDRLLFAGIRVNPLKGREVLNILAAAR